MKRDNIKEPFDTFLYLKKQSLSEGSKNTRPPSMRTEDPPVTLKSSGTGLESTQGSLPTWGSHQYPRRTGYSAVWWGCRSHTQDKNGSEHSNVVPRAISDILTFYQKIPPKLPFLLKAAQKKKVETPTIKATIYQEHQCSPSKSWLDGMKLTSCSISFFDLFLKLQQFSKLFI